MKEETHGGRRIKKKSSGVNVGNRKLSSRSGWVQPGMRVAPLTPSHNPTPAALRHFQSFIHIWYYVCAVVGRLLMFGLQMYTGERQSGWEQDQQQNRNENKEKEKDK